MDFGSAFSYPWKHMGKLAFFGAIYAAIVFGQEVLALALGVSFASLLATLATLFVGLYVSGFTIEIVRHVLHHGEGLPVGEFAPTVTKGFMFTLAGIVYMMPAIIVAFVGFVLLGNPFDPYADTSSINWLAFGLLILIMAVFTSWSLFVAMVRYAIDEDTSVLFSIGENLNIVTNHLGLCFGLFMRQMGLALLWGLIGGVVGAIWGMMAFSMMMNGSQFMMIIMLTAFQFVVMGLNVGGQFSLAHLLTGFARELGLAPEKPKMKPKVDADWQEWGDLA